MDSLGEGDIALSHPDNQDELLTCPGNSDLRLHRDLSDQKQEAEFYRELIARRVKKYKQPKFGAEMSVPIPATQDICFPRG